VGRGGSGGGGGGGGGAGAWFTFSIDCAKAGGGGTGSTLSRSSYRELSKDVSFFTHYYSHNVYSEKSKFKFRS
jgi:hypothetical protein